MDWKLRNCDQSSPFFFQVCLRQMFVTMTESVTNTVYLILIPGWKGRRLHTEKVETYFLEYKTDSNYISIRRTVTVIWTTIYWSSSRYLPSLVSSKNIIPHFRHFCKVVIIVFFYSGKKSKSHGVYLIYWSLTAINSKAGSHPKILFLKMFVKLCYCHIINNYIIKISLWSWKIYLSHSCSHTFFPNARYFFQ